MSRKILDKPRALVLGGSGFVGQNLQKSALLEEFEVLNLDLNATPKHTKNIDWGEILGNAADANFLSTILLDFRPAFLFHLAANSDIKSGQTGNLDLKYTLNTTLALSEALKVYPVDTVVFASSSAVFGEERLNGTTLNSLNVPISAYGIAKLASEKILDSSFFSGTIQKLLTVRFPNVVGEHMTHGLIYDLTSKYIMNSSIIEVLGDGSQEKPYMLATDLLESIFRVIPAFKGKLLVELGPRDTINVKGIVEIFLKALPTKPAVKFGSSSVGWEGDVNKYAVDISLISEVMKDFKIPSSEDSIKTAVTAHLKERLWHDQ
jgi:UDP-glucose 4-epimerase